jgi:uncharacterized protein with HEPN domain
MAKPSLAERLVHIQEAIGQIDSQIATIDEKAFATDRFRQLGIERCLEIISEASVWAIIADDLPVLKSAIDDIASTS